MKLKNNRYRSFPLLHLLVIKYVNSKFHITSVWKKYESRVFRVFFLSSIVSLCLYRSFLILPPTPFDSPSTHFALHLNNWTLSSTKFALNICYAAIRSFHKGWTRIRSIGSPLWWTDMHFHFPSHAWKTVVKFCKLCYHIQWSCCCRLKMVVGGRFVIILVT